MAKHEVIIYLPSTKRLDDVTPRDFIDKYIITEEINDVIEWLQKKGVLPEVDPKSSVHSRVILPKTEPGKNTVLTVHFNGKSYGIVGVGKTDN